MNFVLQKLQQNTEMPLTFDKKSWRKAINIVNSMLQKK